MTGPEVRARWDLVADSTSWQFRPAIDGPVVARLHMTTEQAWRLLSNNLDEGAHGEVRTGGEAEIVETLRRTRAIIGIPK